MYIYIHDDRLASQQKPKLPGLLCLLVSYRSERKRRLPLLTGRELRSSGGSE